MASMLPVSDDVTASNSTIPFARLLDEEDRRREKAALATALDPQGDGSPVHWENGKTNTKGIFTAQGHAFSADSKICRSFVGELIQETVQKTISGTACAVSAGEWAVRDMKSVPKA
jgi:surface antigen